MSAPPKVFLCHASEDKNRFVIKFAELLRANGVDVWLDKWEMLPGDSLVDKIFEEGVKSATAFVVVLSTASVSKPWVKEELNAAFVKRVSSKCRIIPVVLDDCDIPECLRSTFWQRIKDLNDYPDEFRQILNSLFGLSDKPPIGAAPAHSELLPSLSLPALHKIDCLVLEALCEESTRVNDVLVTDLTCLDAVATAGATDEEIQDALKLLGEEHYVELSHVMGPTYRNTHVSHLRIPNSTFDQYARAKWANYDTILRRLVAGIANENWRTRVDMEKVNAPSRLRDHLVRMLEDNGCIRLSRYVGGGYSIWDVSPKLRRILDV